MVDRFGHYNKPPATSNISVQDVMSVSSQIVNEVINPLDDRDDILQAQIDGFSLGGNSWQQIVLVNHWSVIVDDCGSPDAFNTVTLQPGKIYIVTVTVAIPFGLRFSTGTTLRGLSQRSSVLVFEDTVGICFQGENVNVQIQDLRVEGGAQLFEFSSIDINGTAPFYSRDAQMVVKNSEFYQVASLGRITGYNIEVRGCFFNGGSLTPMLRVTSTQSDTFYVEELITLRAVPLDPFGRLGRLERLEGDGEGMLESLVIRIKSISGNGVPLTWMIENGGEGYYEGAILTCTAHPGFGMVVLQARGGSVGGGCTASGLVLLSPRYLGLSETRFAGFRGGISASTAVLLSFDSVLIGGIPLMTFGVLVSGCTFYPQNNETAFRIGYNGSVTHSNVVGNIFMTSPGDLFPIQLSYTPETRFNAVSLKSWNFSGNTNLSNSVPTVDISGAIAGQIGAISTGVNYSAYWSLGEVYDFTRLNRFALYISYVATGSLGNIVTGGYVRHSDSGMEAYIVRTVGGSFYLTNIPVGFFLLGREYLILSPSRTITETTVTISITNNNLNGGQIMYTGVATKTFFISIQISFSVSAANSSIQFAFDSHGYGGLRQIILTTSSDKINAVRTAVLSGSVIMQENQQNSITYANVSGSSLSITLYKMSVTMFSTS